MNTISIGIVDDDTLIVSLLQDYLNAKEDISVLFTAESGEDLMDLLPRIPKLPDVLLLDLKMKKLDGVEVTLELKAHYPSIKVIVVSSHYKNSFMGFMFKTGVAAFLPKGISPIELVEIIRIVGENGFYFKEDQLEMIRTQISNKPQKPVFNYGNVLSEREIEILRLITKQKTAKEIGESLFITQRTVEGHKNNLFVKTGAKNIAGLVIYAIQNQIIRMEDLPLI